MLRTACKRGRRIARGAQRALGSLARLPIGIDGAPPDAALLLSLALRHDLSSYDAAYLELGLRLQLPVATQDAKLANAARTAGIGVYS